MVSTGGYNEFTTGTKGQSVILSINNDKVSGEYISAEPKGTEKLAYKMPNDKYNVSSFTAGTVIFDNDGDYGLTINNVDTNDIHMVGGAFGGLGKASVEQSTIVEYLTDTKGVKNIIGIDFAAIGKKYQEIRDMMSDSDKSVNMKAINSALSMASGIIDDFRGVAIVANKTTEDKSASPFSKFDNLYITDKKGVEHVISADSQEALMTFTAEALMTYNQNIGTKFNVDLQDFAQALIFPEKVTFSVDWINERIDDGEIDKAFVKKYYTFVKAGKDEYGDDVPAHYILNKTALRE